MGWWQNFLVAWNLKKKISTDDKPSVEVKKNIKSSEEKKKQPDKESSEKDTETSVTLLNLQVGLIQKAWKHPSADRYIFNYCSTII